MFTLSVDSLFPLSPSILLWSGVLGMLLWELLSGRKAYTGAQHDGIIIAVTRTTPVAWEICGSGGVVL